MPTEPVGDLIDFNDDEWRMEYGAWTAADDLAFALVQARQMSELSQAELAAKLGTSQAYVAKLESGEANPSIRKVGAILAAMWLRLEMRPVPLRYYQDEHSALLSFSAKGPWAAILGEIPWRPVDIHISSRHQSLNAGHLIYNVKGGEYLICR